MRDALLRYCDEALVAMRDIVVELGDELANRRPDLPGANSPFAILTHCLGLCGYWASTVNLGRVVPRDRDAEFTATGAVADLAARTDQARSDLAAWFASLEPAAGTNGAAGMPGATIYRDGDPARGVPPCQGCHGLDARARVGADDAARARLYPVLRGQHAAYLADRLEDLATHPPHTSTAHVMAPIARTLDAASIEAITHWLEAGAP